ncbi:hypothetical protein GCM10022254_59940 [Actinomadura meridiana]|uniref:Carbohydrate-binding protein n=1 Tax=Actinomadura meridiana TaxID=559626 RepID=A0ABP8CHZ3_9ACTN
MQRRSLLACAVLIASTFVSTGAAAAAATDPSTGTVSPSPNAPKRGVVAGAQNFTPNARNAKAVERFRELNRARVKRDDVHQFWGIEPAAGTHDGFMATQSVDPSYQVSSEEDFTYTPTIKAAGSCMEVTTAYSQVMGNEIWAWDWCGSTGPAKQLQMDDSFMETYTTTVNEHQAYSVQLVQTDAATNEWGAYLYNQKTKAWELFYSQSGSDQSQLNYGWDLFEIYASTDPSTGNAYYCSEAKSVVFESSSIQLRQNGAWRPAGPSDSPWQPTAEPNPNDYLCPTLKFERAGENDHWIVHQ